MSTTIIDSLRELQDLLVANQEILDRNFALRSSSEDTRDEVECEDTESELLFTEDELDAQQQLSDDLEASYGNY